MINATHLRTKPLPLTNGHGRYMAVTHERRLFSVGQFPLHMTAINLEHCALPLAQDFKDVWLPLAAEVQQIDREVRGAGGNEVPGPMFSPIASAGF
jgi:hypothetical protein